jgi:hypothetical protein
MPDPAGGGQGVPAGQAMSHRGRAAVRVAAAAMGFSLAAAMLAGCSVSVGALQHRSRSYPVSGPVQTLVVQGHVGSIEVTGGGSSTISVTEHLTFRQTAPVTTHRRAAGALTLASSCPALESCGVGYDITVPRALAVQVADGVGTVRLHGLTGPVTVQAGTGSIELDTVSGPVKASTHAGQIVGRDISSAQATLRLSAGQIDVTFSAAPTALSATATTGSVLLRVPGGVPYAVHAGTTVGSTQVSVTRSAGSPHIITANTTTGFIVIEPAP